MSRERDLLARILRTIEHRHAPECAAPLGHSCDCYVGDIATDIIDLDIEPCCRCHTREGTLLDEHGAPWCPECAVPILPGSSPLGMFRAKEP